MENMLDLIMIEKIKHQEEIDNNLNVEVSESEINLDFNEFFKLHKLTDMINVKIEKYSNKNRLPKDEIIENLYRQCYFL